MHCLNEGICQKNGCIDGKGDAPLFFQMKSLDVGISVSGYPYLSFIVMKN